MTQLAIRRLLGTDLEVALAVLEELAPVNLSSARAGEVFREMLAKGIETWVALWNDEIVGMATLLIEPKFLRGGAKVGHIEDVAVIRKAQGTGVGKALMERLEQEARQAGCRKLILDCKPSVRPFYEKCGYYEHELQMRRDLA